MQLLRWCPSLDQMHTVFNPNADVIYGVLRYSLYALLTYADVCGRMRTYAMYTSSTACAGTQLT